MRFILFGILFHLTTGAFASELTCFEGPAEDLAPFIRPNQNIITREQYDLHQKRIREFCHESTKWVSRAQEAERNNGRFLSELGNSVLYRGCRSDVPWMQNLRRALCESGGLRSSPELELLQETRIPRRFIFLFDGAAGFNPAQGRAAGAANLSGEERNDRNGYGNGLRNLMIPVRELFSDESEYQLQYHASSGIYQRENIQSAMACARQIRTHYEIAGLLRSELPPPQWITMGFSNGADRAVVLQTRMARAGMPMDLVFSVDPIPQFGSFLFSQVNGSIGNRHPGTRRLINFYQRQDTGTIPVFGLRGKRVTGADANVQLDFTDIPRNRIHSTMIENPRILDSLRCELRKLDEPARECTP